MLGGDRSHLQKAGMMETDFPGTRQTEDDGAYDHLARGRIVPEIALPATTGEQLDVVASSRWTVLFLYPATGAPGQQLPDGWLQTPGAYGCTGESCGFRDLHAELEEAGAQVRGVSTQTPSEQAEFAAREHITYPLLSDHEHRLIEALDLPTFTTGGSPPRIRRATLLVDRDRRIRDVRYPIPDPGGHAAEVLARLHLLNR
jgi:peroxiredoxin